MNHQHAETLRPCPRCDGRGEIDGYWTCGDPACCGSGLIECPDCDGTGNAPTQTAAHAQAGEGSNG